jgi:hypothetical protein
MPLGSNLAPGCYGNTVLCECIFSALCVASLLRFLFLFKTAPVRSTKGVGACIPLYTTCIGIVQFDGANGGGLWQRFLLQFTYQVAPITLLFTPYLRQLPYFFLSFCANYPTFFSFALKVKRPILSFQFVARSLYSSIISNAFKNSMAVAQRSKNLCWWRCSSYCKYPKR